MLWATGYRTDHSWIDVPAAVDDRGACGRSPARARRPASTLGLPWQHTRGSALLGWVGADAQFIAAHIAATAAGFANDCEIGDGQSDMYGWVSEHTDAPSPSRIPAR